MAGNASSNDQTDDSSNPAGAATRSIKPVDALIMKGGGVKGLAFAGAARELQAYFDFRTFVGTSAGAIAAALFAAGATGLELEDRLRRKPFRDFLDGKIWTLPFRFWFKRGLHPGYAFVNWLIRELHRYIPKVSDLTMAELPKRAVIYASQKGAGEITFDTIGERKDDAVHAAVRCSMSIPYFFEPPSVGGRRTFDGGLLHNYPAEIFLAQEMLRKPGAPTPSFVALYLGSDKPQPINPGSVFSELLSISIDRNDAKVIDRYRSQTILIDTEPIGTIDFDLTDQEKDLLVLQGRAAASEFLADGGYLDDAQSQMVRDVRAEAESLRASVIEYRSKRREKKRRLYATVILVSSLILAAIWLFGSQIKLGPGPLSGAVTFMLCVGEHADRCPKEAIYQPCGTTVAKWARDRCTSFSRKGLPTSFPGNQCGYSIFEVICVAPK
jgi:Patatin-like phospholipase